MTKIIAHRGYALLYPENTKVAFDAAYHEHAQGFELDVHLTKDGEVVICHDDKIDRTSNGSGFIKDYTVEELKSFDFAAKFPVNDLYRHPHAEQIMTLREYFEWLDGKNVETNIELKTNVFQYEGIEMQINRLIQEFGQQESVIVSSFNHKSILRMKQENPSLLCGFLTMYGMLEPGEYCRKYGVEYYHPYHLTIDEDTILDCQKNGIEINAWTPNDTKNIKRMLDLKVSRVITDEPKLALQLKNEMLLAE